MIDYSKITPRVIDKYIREKIAELLHRRGIYELGSYGWSGPDDYEDKTIGHAMWQTDSLYFHFLEEHFSATHAHGPKPRILEPWQQFLVQSGGDFEGLMQAAWVSAGLTLFHQQTTDRDHYGENSLFQVHLISSTMLLSTAADRLRDLFIASVFQLNTGQYENARSDADSKKAKDERKAVWYSGPFYEGEQSDIAALYSTDSFHALPRQADQMFGFRRVRNQVVHSISTELGRQQRDLAKKAVPDVVSEEYSYAEMRTWQEQSDADYQARVEADVARLIDWYKLLVEMSNEVFIVENALRHHGYRA